MEHTLVEIGKCRKRLEITFSSEEVDNAFREVYEELDHQVQLKGFRKGKAPKKLLERRFGKNIGGDVEVHLAERHIPEILKESGTTILGNSTPPRHAEPVESGKQLKLSMEFDARPVFDLPEYKGLDLADTTKGVTDEDVERGIERFRKMLADYQPVEEPARQADVVEVDFVAKVDGEEIMNMNDQRIRIEGEALFGLPCPELEAKLVGVKAGDKATLNVAMPEDHPDDKLRGKPADVEIAIKRVMRPELPAVDDALAAKLGMGTLDALKDRVRISQMRENMMAARRDKESEILDKLIGAATFDVPEAFVQAEIKAQEEQARMRLAQSGVSGQTAEVKLAAMRDDFAKAAERSVRWDIIAGTIADKEEIRVTQEELAQHIDALASSYNTTPQKMLQRIREFDGVGRMMKEIVDLKVMQLIIDSAKGSKTEQAASDTAEANASAADAANGKE